MPQQQQQQLPMGPTRWCPTPEQLMILEEMYRGGLRTPNASQIQQITAHLAAYGRIEGKNVFYWFQNHKARDRQKLRRRLCMSHHLLTCAHQYYAAAAAANHGHHAFLAAPAPAYGCGGGGGVLDQAAAAGQLLAQTSPTPAAAAAAYGYYYPAATAFAAAPPATTTPPSTPNQLFNIYHQGRGGGGVAPAAETLGRPENSLGKLDNLGVAAPDDDMRPPGFELQVAPAAFCRPLKTLDLFPGGLEEEQHDVA